MRRIIYIFLIIDVVLATMSVCVWLLPDRITTRTNNIKYTTIQDTANHASPKERQQPTAITHNPKKHISTISGSSPNNGEVRWGPGQGGEASPFYKEASKILASKISEDDASNRRIILNYCEHLRTAYTSKDIDFIKQVFSEKALIIVGNVIKETNPSSSILRSQKEQYFIRSKQQYIANLKKVFSANKSIDIHFSDFAIYRHPTKDGIYGVTLRQQYQSDRYSDDGYLFLLWDFQNPSMPMIHVRVWQPTTTLHDNDDIISLSDFNLD